MGPGFFPIAVGVLLVALGAATVAKAFLSGEAGKIGVVPWRAVLLIVGAIVFFGATVRGLGLVPALLVTIFATGVAARGSGVIAPAVIAVVLTIVSLLIFIVGLNLRLPVLGPWLGG